MKKFGFVLFFILSSSSSFASLDSALTLREVLEVNSRIVSAFLLKETLEFSIFWICQVKINTLFAPDGLRTRCNYADATDAIAVTIDA